MTVAIVLSTAAASGVKVCAPSSAAMPAYTPSATAATSQPTPGKCAALARSMAGL